MNHLQRKLDRQKLTFWQDQNHLHVLSCNYKRQFPMTNWTMCKRTWNANQNQGYKKNNNLPRRMSWSFVKNIFEHWSKGTQLEQILQFQTHSSKQISPSTCHWPLHHGEEYGWHASNQGPSRVELTMYKVSVHFQFSSKKHKLSQFD